MTNFVLKILSKPSWAVQKAYLWGRSLAGLRRDDVVFAFFPKTGSTWVRLFFFNLFSVEESRSPAKLSFDAIDAAMPEFANPSFFLPWPFDGVPRIIKTHRPFYRFWAGRKTVVFIREPRDTMVSFLHYANAKKEFQFSGDLDALLRHPEMGLDAYFRFYASWLARDGLVVKYEDLRLSPVATFAGILRYIGLDANENAIALALDASSLEKTRKAQEESSSEFKDKFKDGFVFARKGRIGDGQSLFSPEQEAYFQERRRHWGFTSYE